MRNVKSFGDAAVQARSERERAISHAGVLKATLAFSVALSVRSHHQNSTSCQQARRRAWHTVWQPKSLACQLQAWAAVLSLA
jgi:hypothetical protein